MTWLNTHSAAALAALKIPVDDGVTPGGGYKLAAELVGPAGSGFTTATVTGAGHLILTRTDGSLVDVGSVQGAIGLGILSAAITGGHLILTRTDGTTLDAGAALGPAGPGFTSAAVTGGHLILTRSDGTTLDAGSVAGPTGPGFSGAAITGGHLILTRTDGTTIDLGSVVGSGGTGGSVATPVTNTYTASGAIAPSDALALVNSSTACAMTLAAGTTDGQPLRIKRFGAGTVTVTANIDGTAGATLTADNSGLHEMLHLIWAATLGTWLTAA